MIVQNHPTFYSEESLVYLVKRRECFVCLSILLHHAKEPMKTTIFCLFPLNTYYIMPECLNVQWKCIVRDPAWEWCVVRQQTQTETCRHEHCPFLTCRLNFKIGLLFIFYAVNPVINGSKSLDSGTALRLSFLQQKNRSECMINLH